MKRILLIVLAIFCTSNARAWESGEDAIRSHRYNTGLKELRAKREEFKKSRATFKDPKELAEIDQVIAGLADAEQNVKAEIKALWSRLDIHRPCPVCGGKLVRVRSVRDSRSKPSTNSEVWRRGGPHCTPSGFTGDSPICTRCWFAQSFWFGSWTRSADRDAFLHPFNEAICNFPLPQQVSFSTYQQKFENGKRSEQLHFYCDGSRDYLERARAYANDKGLLIEISGMGSLGIPGLGDATGDTSDGAFVRVSTAKQPDFIPMPKAEK